jgi:23S rRNA pseudouridine1911/1915/1917 synthase
MLEAYTAGRATPLASRVRCHLETGRTHQIRVHMAHMRMPLLGDVTYGAHFASKEKLLSEEARAVLSALGRQALHASLLGFEHPVSGKVLRFESELPADLSALHTMLKSPLSGV